MECWFAVELSYMRHGFFKPFRNRMKILSAPLWSIILKTWERLVKTVPRSQKRSSTNTTWSLIPKTRCQESIYTTASNSSRCPGGTKLSSPCQFDWTAISEWKTPNIWRVNSYPYLQGTQILAVMSPWWAGTEWVTSGIGRVGNDFFDRFDDFCPSRSNSSQCEVVSFSFI